LQCLYGIKQFFAPFFFKLPKEQPFEEKLKYFPTRDFFLRLRVLTIAAIQSRFRGRRRKSQLR
jgi:hypothetical protein